MIRKIRSRLKVIIPIVALLVLGVLYKTVLANPTETHPRVPGHVYVLPKEFVVNLADGHYARVTVGLVLAESEEIAEPEAGVEPPDGFGPLGQEAVIREVVTETLTDSDPDALIDRGGRRQLKDRMLRAIHRESDVAVDQVLFTDIAVQ